jgi:hypothetical protein
MRKTLEKGQLIPIPPDWHWRRRRDCLDGESPDTILDGMRPQKIGQVLGIGVRVAGRMAGQRLAGEPLIQSASAQPSAAQAAAPVSSASSGISGSARRSAGGFLQPFRRVGGIVFLEVAGVFFLLFVLLFGEMLWRMRSSYAAGPDHQKFLAAAALLLVFLYLSLSSFWRARKK